MGKSATELPPWEAEERAELERLAKLPPEKKRSVLANRLKHDETARRAMRSADWFDLGGVDREATGIDGKGFGEIGVLDSTPPDELLIRLEETLPDAAGDSPELREIPLGAGARAAVLREFLGWCFDRGHWGEIGQVTRRVFAVARAACPEFLERYNEPALRLLLSRKDDPISDGRTHLRRRAIFDDDRCARLRLSFEERQPLARPVDLPMLCALGMGECLPNLDVVKSMLAEWFEPLGGRKFYAPPGAVMRRAVVTAWVIRPELVRGATLEELGRHVGRGHSTMQLLVRDMFIKRGLVAANCRPKAWKREEEE